jgi:hypothetical protein
MDPKPPVAAPVEPGAKKNGRRRPVPHRLRIFRGRPPEVATGAIEAEAEAVTTAVIEPVTGTAIDPRAENETETERRSGEERRRTSFEKRRHSFYCALFRIKPHNAFVELKAGPPVPAAKLTDANRVDVLLSLHDNVREAIHQWENRIFQAFLISEGALLSAVVFFLEHPNLRSRADVLGFAVAIFGVAALTYLYLAAKAHANNGVVLVKVEAALGLCTEGEYIRGKAFFGYTGYWVEDWRTPILLLIHAGVVAFATFVVSSGFSP